MLQSLPVIVALAFSLYLSLIDLREMRIPNRILLVAMFATFSSMVAVTLHERDVTRLLQALMGGLVSVLIFFLIHLAKPSGLGMGDVKFAGLIGASLAWISFPAGLFGLVIAFMSSALYSITVLVFRPKSHQRVIPFAPFMSLGLFFLGVGLLI